MGEQEQERQQDEPEQADLEVAEEQADEVEGGGAKAKFAADRDPHAARGHY
jgi:hypothetical protein